MQDRSMIELVHNIIRNALQKNASDIHFEPYENFYRIRYRLDGLLSTITSPHLSLALRIASRIKLLANLDIAERRLPQDGRFQFFDSEGPPLDLRVSTCPVSDGEKIVIRILHHDASQLNIDTLGLSLQQKEIFLKALHRPQGMILVTGGTGCGKTLTLYTALDLLNSEKVNIATVEDPVEIKIPGINQVAFHSKSGLSFSKILKAFLRQDPDIIMLGEMRDLETAEIAFKAAQTGHLLLSTLHTNSAAESITRLRNLGISSFNIASSLSLVMAQRLVRKLCEQCKIPRDTPNNTSVLCYQAGKGCAHCHQGYSGRIGLFELMPISQEIAQKIIEEAHASIILKQAYQEGFLSLQEAGLQAVHQGITSFEEIANL